MRTMNGCSKQLHSLLLSYLQASQSALTPLWLLRANSKSTDLIPNFDREEKHTFQCPSSSGRVALETVEEDHWEDLEPLVPTKTRFPVYTSVLQ